MPLNECGLQAAESNRAILRYIVEDPDCWGDTPSSGPVREMRITSSSLTSKKDTVVSNELRADRMIPDVIEVASSSGGDVKVEFSAGSLDDFMQAFLQGTWSRPMTFDKFQGTLVSINNAASTEIKISGADYTDYFFNGQEIKTEGFTNPANNNYWSITSVAFGSGVTTITCTTDTGITEAGNAYGRVMDANDVIVLKSTVIRAGTGGLNIFDSAGGNIFSTPISAGELVVGMKIAVSGLGYETGTIQAGAGELDGETFIINDGVNSVTFEYDSNDAFERGNVQVEIGVNANATAANIQAAIMDQLRKNKLLCSASVSTDTVTVRNVHPDQFANASTTAITEQATSTVVSSFAGGTNTHGVYTITALTSDVITVAETVAINANAGPVPVTIKGSHLRNPGDLDEIIRQSFSIETGFSDVSQYFLVKGLRVGSFELSLSSGEIVNGMVAFEGKDTSLSTVSAFASGYDLLASTSTPILNATTNVGQIFKNGEELSSAIQSISIKGDASLRAQRAVGSKFPAGIGVGRFMLSGKVTSYFETLDMYDHFLNHDTVSLGFNFLDNDRNYYFFTIPALKFTTDPISPSGIDKDVMEELEWVAIRDSNLNTQFMIDRFSSLLPPSA